MPAPDRLVPPFQFLYRHDFVKERGRLIGAQSVSDDPRLRHCRRVGQLQSELQYRRQAVGSQAHCHLPMDMVPLVHARKAQALASDHDYRTRCHAFTALPEDLKMAWAKKAHALQSEVGGACGLHVSSRPSCSHRAGVNLCSFLSSSVPPEQDSPGLCPLGEIMQSIIQQTFTKHLLCTWHPSRPWGFSSQQSIKKALGSWSLPFTRGTSSLSDTV